jgi:hypothetical protein
MAVNRAVLLLVFEALAAVTLIGGCRPALAAVVQRVAKAVGDIFRNLTVMGVTEWSAPSPTWHRPQEKQLGNVR